MSRICTYCGTPANDAQVYCGRCGATLPQAQQPYQQQPYQQQPYQTQPSQAQPPQKELGMKWFKFLIYFSLFAGAILNAASAVQALNGLHYGSTERAEIVYAFFPDMKNLDMFYGASMIVIAVLGIVARFQLSGFKKSGPAVYYAMLALSILVQAIYIFGTEAAIEKSNLEVANDMSSTVASMCVSIAMLVCNITYFNKRKHLFVN